MIKDKDSLLAALFGVVLAALLTLALMIGDYRAAHAESAPPTYNGDYAFYNAVVTKVGDGEFWLVDEDGEKYYVNDQIPLYGKDIKFGDKVTVVYENSDEGELALVIKGWKE